MQPLLFDAPPPLADLLRLIAESESLLLKFLSANDLGLTGSHQDGIYLPRESWPLFFEQPGAAGENQERVASIEWGPELSTPSAFKWYGQSKKEYRLTRITPVFRGQEERYLGALLLLADHPRRGLQARLLDQDEQIEAALQFLGITPEDTGRLFRFDLDERLRPWGEEYAAQLAGAFPETNEISRRAQQVYQRLHGEARHSADEMLLWLVRIEYALFQCVERSAYAPYLQRGFRNLEELLAATSEINNRRKSRAGRSLENHLHFIFQGRHLRYSVEASTEQSNRPDFIFPGQEQYNNPEFPAARLLVLAAKTTCKDRWRQVLEEAKRVATKHLCTLQQGLSSAQLEQMSAAGVQLVSPQPYHRFFKEEDRDRLMTLEAFVELALDRNGRREDLFQSP
ncbi:MAG: type II restriction endonuclease [Leptospirales bacterium]|nr:type II restriction endonuclease [Leptospirales bacterium]